MVHPESILEMSRINLPWTLLERQIMMSTLQDVRLGRPRDVSLGHCQAGQIGSLEDVLGTLEWDVIRTSWGRIFAGWDLPCI